MQNDKFRPSVRYVNGIQIYFKSKTVVQISQHGHCFNIVRWDRPGGGTYSQSWLPFCRKLYHLNSITDIYHIMRLANHYDLMMTKAYHPEQPPPNIWVRPSKYIWPRKKGKRNGNFSTNKD